MTHNRLIKPAEGVLHCNSTTTDFKTLDFEALVQLYIDMLHLQDAADSEGYAGDSAMASGDTLKAEQHYRSSQQYRTRKDAHSQAIDRMLARCHRSWHWLFPQRLARRALAKARELHYGEDIPSRPYVD